MVHSGAGTDSSSTTCVRPVRVQLASVGSTTRPFAFTGWFLPKREYPMSDDKHITAAHLRFYGDRCSEAHGKIACYRAAAALNAKDVRIHDLEDDGRRLQDERDDADSRCSSMVSARDLTIRDLRADLAAAKARCSELETELEATRSDMRTWKGLATLAALADGPEEG